MSTPERDETAQLRAALSATSTALACAAQANTILAGGLLPSPPSEPAPELSASAIGILGRNVTASVRDIAPRTRTTIAGDHVVIDAATGLMWDTRTLPDVDFAAAERACTESRLAGFDDWRLPTRMELESILDLTKHDPAIDTSLFEDTRSSAYWSSTPCAWSPASYAWIVHFYGGNADGPYRASTAFVRAVRSARARQ